jgi:N-terminal domain on NACHT_NTPase and P-loop NTPases
MDPITAISFASSILTFVDFGLKIVTGTLEVVKSGSLVHNSNIAIVINDFHDVVSSLGRHPQGTSAHELALKELATKCQQVSQKLIELLDTLKTSPNSSTWQGMKITLRSMRKKGEVANLESQLDKYRSEIMTRVLLILK